jgi:hypothetical protein
VVYNDAKWNLEKRFSDFAELDAALDEAFKNNEDVTVRLISAAHLTLQANPMRSCACLSEWRR